MAAPAALADLSQPPYGERAVVLAATGEVVGLVGLVPALGPFAQLEGAAPGGPWTPELGLYWALAPEHRGRGYATEAVAELARHLFAALNPGRLIATTERANARLAGRDAAPRHAPAREPPPRAGVAPGRGRARARAVELLSRVAFVVGGLEASGSGSGSTIRLERFSAATQEA